MLRTRPSYTHASCTHACSTHLHACVRYFHDLFKEYHRWDHLCDVWNHALSVDETDIDIIRQMRGNAFAARGLKTDVPLPKWKRHQQIFRERAAQWHDARVDLSLVDHGLETVPREYCIAKVRVCMRACIRVHVSVRVCVDLDVCAC